MLEKLKQLADGANYPAQKEVLDWAVAELATKPNYKVISETQAKLIERLEVENNKLKSIVLSVIYQYGCEIKENGVVVGYSDCAISTLEEIFDFFGFEHKISLKDLKKLEQLTEGK